MQEGRRSCVAEVAVDARAPPDLSGRESGGGHLTGKGGGGAAEAERRGGREEGGISARAREREAT
jgi:hypothetical protein